MEIGKDLMAGLRSQVLSGAKAAPVAGFDWPGLHARLSAAHAARQVLGQGESPAALLGGGFADWSQVAAPGGNPSQGVNLNNSTDGKEPQGIAVEAADYSRMGG